MALLAAGPALAQGQDERQQDPVRMVNRGCKDDLETYCPGNDKPGLAFARACLRQNWLNLSHGCRAALKATDLARQTDSGDDNGL